MTVIVRSLIADSQTLDSVVLPGFAVQIRNLSTAALVAAVAAKTITMDQYDGVEYNAPLTNTLYQVPNACTTLICNPAGTIAAHTIVMPAAPVDRQELEISFGAPITALTMTPSGTQTIKAALTAATANGFARWRYNQADNTWWRLG